MIGQIGHVSYHLGSLFCAIELTGLCAMVWSSIIIGDKHVGYKSVQILRKVAHGTFLYVRTRQNPMCDLKKLAFQQQNAKVVPK